MSAMKSLESGKTVMDVIKKYSDKGSDLAFYVADLADVVNKCRYWRAKLPQVEPFYAVKCNPDPMVLRLLVAMGTRFDCASKGEIEAVLSAGAHPSDIIYAHPYKSNIFLKYAAAQKVDLMTFDSEQEILKIHNVYPQARLVLRIRIPDVPAAFPLSDKFGCEPLEAQRLLVLARQLGMNVVGTSFHVGSLCEQPSAFERAIGMAREVFDAAALLGFRFDLLDIGGGFPGASGTLDRFDEMCFFINRGLKEHFPEGCGVKVMAEPGCYLVCSAFTLCTKIIGKKFATENIQEYEGVVEKKPKCFYYMNDGVYGSFGYGFEKYGIRVKPILSESQLLRRPVLPSKLWGATCCSADCILEDCLLPEMEVGECVAFSNMGAYTRALASVFNGFPKSATRYHFSGLGSGGNKLRRLPPFEDFCQELGTKQLKAFVKIQEFICHDDSNDDLFRKG